MKITTTLQLGLLLASLPAVAGPSSAAAPPRATTIEFVANRRQWEKPVLFAADVPSGRLFLEHGRLVQAIYDGKRLEELHHKSAEVSDQERIRAHAYYTTFVGANPAAAVKGEAQLPGLNNYFLGNDKSRWASNVPGYGEVRYAGLYPGIDLHFYSKERVLEYDFEVAAGADAGRIALRYAGQTKLSVVDGALHIGTSVGTVVEQRPYAYQLVAGQRQRVACEYALGAGNTVKFALPQGYNHALPLVIDPVLVYSSYTNSTNNYGYTATYDTLGNLYAGGSVFSAGYPTTAGAYDVTWNQSTDMGIIKYNPAATTGPASRVYATYVGGNLDDHPHSLVVDRGNNLIILGSSGSSTYPTTVGAYSRTLSGTADIVLTKLDPTGSSLVGSTFLGGSGIDGRVIGATNVNYGDTYRGDVTIDRQNNIYIASITASTNFPTTSAAFQRTLGGGGADGVVSKLNASLTALTWSTYLGGSGADAAYSIQLDSVNHVFVSGGTASTNFPGTTGGLYGTYRGGVTDGFVSRISAAGDDLVQSTYLGTAAYDQAHFVQLNRRGEVYAYGQTLGTYPVSAGVYANPGSRQFIQKLNPMLTTSLFSTVIGNGAGTTYNLSPTAFLVDNCGQIMISGWTSQGNMPVTVDAIQSSGGTGTTGTNISGYFYIGQLSANAQSLVYGTYFGNGSCHVDGGTSRFDKKGIIYQSMCVGSGVGTIPTTPNAWSRTNGSGYNNAAFKIDVLQLNASFVPAISATSTIRRADLCAPARFYFNRPVVAGTTTLWNFGNGQTSTQPNNATTLYQTPGRYPVRLTVSDASGCQVSVTTVDTVIVYAVPVAQVAASSRQGICAGAAATLTAANLATNTPAIVYTWTAPGQPTLTGATITVRPTATTRYTVTISTPSTAGGCTATDTVTVRVLGQPLNANFIPSLTLASTVRQTGRCAPAQFFFNRPSVVGNSTLWNFGNGQTSTQANNATATYTTPGKYPVRLTVSDTNGCSLTVTTVDTVVVYAVPRPQVAPAGRQAICGGSATTLQVSNLTLNQPNVTYTWTAPGQPTQTGQSIMVQPAASTRYTVTASTPANVGSCSATDTVTVRVRARLVVSAGPARTVCPNEPTALSVADFGTGATYTWTAPGQPPVSGRNVTVRTSSSVRYLVRIVDAYGCQGRDSVLLTVPPRPLMAAVVSSPNLINRPVVFTNTTTGATSYRWDFGDNSPVSTEINPMHVYTAPAIVTPYQARLTAIYGPGCETSIMIPVPVRGFDAPNIITPNGDKLNDTFRPFVTTEKVNVQIFNRWGRLVYEQKDYAGTWGDATTPVGLYYYQLVSTSGETWKGWLEVVK